MAFRPSAFALILPLLAAGCGSDLGRQAEWVDSHPKAPQRIKKVVLGKGVVQGMPQDAVLASWGEPESKLDLGGGDASWVYHRPQHRASGRVTIEYTLIFNRGMLERILQEVLR